MAKELDSFLDGEDAGQAEVAQPSAAEESPEALSPAAEPRAPTSIPEPAAEPVDETEHPVPDDVAGLRAAVQAERAKRRDYKGERDRLQGEMAAIRAQLEAASKAPPPPPPPPAPEVRQQPEAVPSPDEDPQGYHAYQQG